MRSPPPTHPHVFQFLTCGQLEKRKATTMHIWKLVSVALLGLFAVNAAQAKASHGPVVTPSSGGFNIKYAKDGTPLAVPSNGSGGVVVATPATINLGPLITAQVAASAIITGAQIAGPWGAAAAGLGVVAVFAIPAFADAYSRAKLRVNPSTGALEKDDPAVCTVGPCYGWNTYANNGIYLQYFSSYAEACSFMVARYTPGSGGGAICVVNGAGTSFDVRQSNGFVYTGAGGRAGQVAPSAPGFTSASLAEAQAAMSLQVPTVAQVDALADLGFQPETGPVTITGPAEVPGANTVKILADGSQRTEACKYYLEYFPSNIKAHPECTATTVMPEKTETHTETVTGPDGLPITKTVTTTTPGKTTTEVITTDKLPEPTACGLPGAPACKIDETGTATGIGALPQNDFETELNKAKDALPGIVDPAGKDAGWGVLPHWTEQGACVPWHLFTLPPAVGSRSVDLDLCPLKPLADGVSNFIWIALAFMGITSMVFSTMTSKAA